MADLLERVQEALASRYRIERELGAGGMAVVFLAEDLRHGRRVAVKVLRPELAAKIGPQRFLREIRMAAGLSHPHILALHDSGEAAGFLYYVMPYMEGDSLRKRLAREKQLPVDDALQIAREVADALSYAHRHGVVHRDIKPENILLESGHAIVADFGIARAITAAGDETATSTGVVLGTPAYMSPEQASGSRNLDGRSDVYALGCVLYEMLAGQPPFNGPTVESLMHQHLTVEAPSVALIRPTVPGWVAAAVKRSLAKTPADRFSPIAQFAEALARGETAATAAGRGSADTTGTAPATFVRESRRRPRLALLGGAIGVAVISVIVAGLLIHPGKKVPSPAEPAHTRSEIAVLPFQNLSADAAQAYFAGGLHDELLTQLAKVASLKVISRTSVMGYQGTTKPLKQIAAELGVGSVVEGSVQVVGGRLRVTVQLIDAATDEHLWAENYDRTLDDAFTIQSEVAQRIVAAVGAALTRTEQGSLTAAPTANAEAYELYLQGHEYWSRPGRLRPNLEVAQRLYERALALDPQFALAHAALSQVHGEMYWVTYDHSPARAARQLAEAETALRLAPNLPQAHIAMGLAHYFGRRDYRRALDEYAIALQGLPNDAELWGRIGYVHRRLGDWNEVLGAYENATRLNPRDVDLLTDLGANTYEIMHRYGDEVLAYDKALSLAPDLYSATLSRGWTYVDWEGQTDTLRVALDRWPRDADQEGLVEARAGLLLLERDYDSLLQLLDTAHIDVFEDQGTYQPSALVAGWAHKLRGDGAAARAAFGSALVRLDSVLTERPDDWRVHSSRGDALAGLGRRDEALREARWLQQSVINREDALGRGAVAGIRARIFAQVGDTDAALDEIERQLVGPGLLSVHRLRLDPSWDPIREEPRFKALLAKYGSRDAR